MFPPRLVVRVCACMTQGKIEIRKASVCPVCDEDVMDVCKDVYTYVCTTCVYTYRYVNVRCATVGDRNKLFVIQVRFTGRAVSRREGGREGGNQ